MILRQKKIIKELIHFAKREFNDFCYQVQKYIPEYKDRNRQKYILQLVFELSWHFNLGVGFYYQAKKILHKMWNGIKNTTDNVIAGVISSISVLCSRTFKKKIKISTICEHLDISMSTIQKQVEKKIVERFNVEGFVSLVKSAGLLEEICEKIGLIDKKEVDVPEGSKIDLVFGNAAEIFNHHDDTNYYLFAIRGDDESFTTVHVQVYHPLMNFKELKKAKVQNTKFLQFELVKYTEGKDPP